MGKGHDYKQGQNLVVLYFLFFNKVKTSKKLFKAIDNRRNLGILTTTDIILLFVRSDNPSTTIEQDHNAY